MDKLTKQEVIAMLRRISQGDLSDIDEVNTCGLCVEVLERNGEVESWWRNNAESILSDWERWSGCETFPVPSRESGLDEYDAYLKTKGSKEAMYGDNKYGRLRRDLARHIADKLKEQL